MKLNEFVDRLENMGRTALNESYDGNAKDILTRVALDTFDGVKVIGFEEKEARGDMFWKITLKFNDGIVVPVVFNSGIDDLNDLSDLALHLDHIVEMAYSELEDGEWKSGEPTYDTVFTPFNEELTDDEPYNEAFTRRDPKDRRKKVVIPDDLEDFLNSKEWNKVVKSISKYCYDYETKIDKDTYYFEYIFTLSSKRNTDESIDDIFNMLGISQEDSSMGDLSGWGYSDFEGTKLINGMPIKVSASYGFRLLTVTILYKLKELPEDNFASDAEKEYRNAFSEYSKDNSEENRDKLLNAKKNLQSDHRKRYGEELTEARNPENDEINAIIRKNLGKKNISKKDMQALEDAGIIVYSDGDMRGPNGRLLQKDHGEVHGPSQTLYKYNKHNSPFGRGRNGDRTTTYWNLRKNSRGWASKNADKFDEVDLKNYFDKPVRSSEWEREQEINKSLRPYSDDYKDAKEHKDFHDSVTSEYSDGLLSDEEIEAQVQEYRDSLMRRRDYNKSTAEYNTKESQRFQQRIDDAKARAKARHPQYKEGLNESMRGPGLDAMREIWEIADEHEILINLIQWLPDDMLLKFAEEWFDDDLDESMRGTGLNAMKEVLEIADEHELLTALIQYVPDRMLLKFAEEWWSYEDDLDESLNESAEWKYKLKSGPELRTAINEENYANVLNCLEKAWREINKQFPDEYEDYELDNDLEDIENERDNLLNYEDYDLTIDEVEDNINYLLTNFYDYCDATGIWIEL